MSNFSRPLLQPFFQELRGRPTGKRTVIHSVKKCATSLLYSYLETQETTPGFTVNTLKDMALFADVVDAYDRWLLGSMHRERSEGMNRLLYFWGFERFVEKMAKSF